MQTTTLEEFFKKNRAEDIIDYRVRSYLGADGVTHFYIHPLDRNGETLDFTVAGNDLQLDCQQVLGNG